MLLRVDQSTLCGIFVNLLNEISSSYDDLNEAIKNSENFRDPEFRSAIRRCENLSDAWADEFFLLSEVVESPIEQLLGAYLLTINDGYNWISYSAATAGDFVHEIEYGTQFVCQGCVGLYRVDFLFQLNGPEGQRFLAVECDGHDFHERTKLQAQRDKSRDREMKMIGLDVIRFTGSEIFCDPRKCADEVTNHLSQDHGSPDRQTSTDQAPIAACVPAVRCRQVVPSL